MKGHDYFTLSDGTEVHILYTKPEKNRLKGHIRLNGKDLSADREIALDGEEAARSQIYRELKGQAEFTLECFKEQCNKGCGIMYEHEIDTI